MTRQELGTSLNLEERLIPQGNANRSGRPLRPTKICVHNTDNSARGADAIAHSRHLIQNAGDSGNGPTSWHYTVDDTRVVKHLPLGEIGFHAYASGNSVSLGIEMCMNSDGNWSETVDRTARLVAVLCFDFGWGIGSTKQHHDFPRSNGTRKNCPSRIRSDFNGTDWNDFIALSKNYFDQMLSAEGFVHGFTISKEVRATENEVNFTVELNEELDIDHGDEIIIPDELLNYKE